MENNNKTYTINLYAKGYSDVYGFQNSLFDLLNSNKPIYDEVKPHQFTFIYLLTGIDGFHLAVVKLGGKCVLASNLKKFNVAQKNNKIYNFIYEH